MAEHSDPAQRAPRPGQSYAGLPVYEAAAGQRFFRNHEDRPGMPDRGVWWFSSAPADPKKGGRFDLPAPEGTCYLADTAKAAVYERVGGPLVTHGWLPADLVTGRVVSEVDLPKSVRAAAVSADGVEGIVNAELTSSSDYAMTQACAARIREDGFDGIRYTLRYTPVEPRGLAMFGPAGSSGWAGDPDPTPMESVLRDLGLKVMPTPASGSMKVVSP